MAALTVAAAMERSYMVGVGTTTMMIVCTRNNSGNGADLRATTAASSDEYWGTSEIYAPLMACIHL